MIRSSSKIINKKFLNNNFKNNNFRNKIFKNKIFKFIIIFLISGFVLGLYSSSKIENSTVSFSENKATGFNLFINTFCYHFWYYFINWLFGIYFLGFIINYFITFFKGFIYGVILGIILKSAAILSTFVILKSFIFDFIIIIPGFIYLTYTSVKYSLNKFNNLRKNIQSFDSYLNKLIFLTISLFIYAIIIMLVGSFVIITN